MVVFIDVEAIKGAGDCLIAWLKVGNNRCKLTYYPPLGGANVFQFIRNCLPPDGRLRLKSYYGRKPRKC